MYFKASLLSLFGWREATIGNTSAFEGYKALNSRVSVRVPSHETSHHIPEMESLLAHLSVWRLWLQELHRKFPSSNNDILHIGGDLIWNVYYYIKQLNWTERSHIFQISPSVASSESTDSPFSCTCKVKQSRRVNPRKDYYPQAKLLETFRFEDEDHYVDEISLESVLRSLKKIDTPSFISLFSPEKLTRLFLLKEVKPSSDPKVIRLQTFDNLIISVTTAFLLKPVVESRRISRFPAKMALVHTHAARTT